MSSDAHSTSDTDDAPRPFVGHTNFITALEYSPDGRLIATASWDATVRLWDPLTGQQLQKIEVHQQALALNFSPSSRQLATICADASAPVASVLVWEVEKDGVGVVESSEIKTEYASGDPITLHFVRFSNDGKLLAVMTPLLVTLQDAETGKPLFDVFKTRQDSRLMCLLGFASGDQRLLFACRDQASSADNAGHRPPIVYSFDLATRQQTRIDLSITPSQRLSLLVSSYDGAMIAGNAPPGSQIWKTDTGKVLQGPLAGHVAETSSICFSRDALWLIDASSTSSVCVWETSTGKRVLGPLRQNSGSSLLIAVACSPLKDRIACTDSSDNVHVWDVSTQKIVLSSVPATKEKVQPMTMRNRVDSVQWFPDGQHFVTSSAGDDHIRTWDAHSGEQVRQFLFHGGSCIALSADGAFIAAGSTRPLGSVALLDAKTGKERSPSLMGPGNKCHRLKFSPAGVVLAVILHDWKLCILSDILGARKTVFVKNQSNVLDVTFSPDGQHFAYATANDGVLVCDISSMDVVHRFSAKTSDPFRSVSFSPNGRRLVACSRELMIWDLDNNHKLLHLFETQKADVTATFSPDGQTLLCSLRASPLQMINAATGRQVWQIKEKAHTAEFAFAPGGERILVGFMNGTMRVYDAVTGRVLLPKQKRSSAKEDSSGDGSFNADDGLDSMRPGPSHRRLNIADIDDDFVFNISASSRQPGTIERSSAKRGTSKRDRDRPNSGEPRRGLVERLISRFRLSPSMSDGSEERRHRIPRVFEMVSGARGKARVAAAGPSEQDRRRDRRPEVVSDDSSSSPSPPASLRGRVDSVHTGADGRRSNTPSSDGTGVMDVVYYFLCIPRCRSSGNLDGIVLTAT